MRVSIKDLDGQRSIEIEVTEQLPNSVFLSRGDKCIEFDLAIFLHAVNRAQDTANV